MARLKRLYHLANLFWLMIAYALFPKSVRLTFLFADHLIGLGAYSEIEGILTADKKSKELIERRNMIEPKHLSELGKLPRGTLGREFAEHMFENELNPDFYPPLKITSDKHYVLQRIRALHDVLHVLTGFDTSENGEVALQAFLLGQLASPFSMMVVGGFIFFAPFKRRPYPFRVSMDMISEGWRMGRLAKPVFNYDWNEAWKRPLEEVRADLNLKIYTPFDSLRFAGVGDSSHAARSID